MIVAIDPGTTRSAFVMLDRQGNATVYDTLPNEDVTYAITQAWVVKPDLDPPRVIAIEKMARMGAMVGASTFETARWIGRFEAELEYRFQPFDFDMPEIRFVPRTSVKMWFLGTPKGKDSQVTRAVAANLGSTPTELKGVKKHKGPLFGIKGHEWQALAVARYVYEHDTTPVSPGVQFAPTA